MDDDINIIEYNLPDCFVIFTDLSSGSRRLLRSCTELSLTQLIDFYLSIQRNFQVLYIPWNEVDPYFERNDCLIFCNGVVL